MQTTPFSTKQRQLWLESLPGGSGFAFDFDEPSGVKFLSSGLFLPLREALDSKAPPSANKQLLSAKAQIRQNPYSSNSAAKLRIWLHVINACNFACHYCYIPHLNRSVNKRALEAYSIGPAHIHPILRSLVAYCEAKNLTELDIIFAGGEPTLNMPLVEQFCVQASEFGSLVKITFGMISNGSFSPKELLPVLERYSIRLSISVDGYQESHDRIRFELQGRKKQGSWQKLTENVRRLAERGISPYFLYTVTLSNVASIHEFAAYAHSRGLGFRLSLVRGKSEVRAAVQTSIAETLSEFYDHLAETVDVDLPILRYAAFAEWNLYQAKRVACSSCRNYFAIGSDGSVGSCQMRMDRSYGNAGAEPLSEIVARIRRDPENADLTKPDKRRGVCVQCQFYHVCAGGCSQHNLLVFGATDHPSPWCHVYGTVLPRYIRAIARQLQRAVANRS